MSLRDLIESRSSSPSSSLEKLPESLAVSDGDEATPSATGGMGVPGDDQTGSFSSEATTPLDQGTVTSDPAPEGRDAAKSSVVAEPAASLGNINVTPSGIQVYFEAAPRRLYRIATTEPGPTAVPAWMEVPSVTKILDILEKGGLSWWGMRVGIAGTLELLNRGYRDQINLMTEEEVETELKTHKLTVNDTLTKAGDRGTSVHDAFELWATTGLLPQVDIYSPAESGFVKGLLDFIIDSGLEPHDSEVMVGSLKHKYAGRYDLNGIIPKGANVVVKTFPKSKPIRMQLPGGFHLLDLKTSKDVYDTHFLQLEAYEEASVENGYTPTDYRAVIHVTEDGRYELVFNLTKEKKAPDFERNKRRVEFKDFMAVRRAYSALERIKSL